MRPLTKIILVLTLVGMAVGALFIASRDWSDLDKYKLPGPKAVQETADKTTEYNDPVAMYQRWRERLTQRDEGDAAKPKTDTKTKTGVKPRTDTARDLISTSRDEGTIVARRLDTDVAGADPPGPVLRPGGIAGEVVTEPLRTRRDAADENTYVIQTGDTLYAIAVARYGHARFVQTITKANPSVDPDRLRVGDRLVLPKPEEKKPAGAPPEPKRQKVYVVKGGDTLIGIARQMYGDAAMYPKIYEANKDVLSSLNARLYVGMRLRLPEP